MRRALDSGSVPRVFVQLKRSTGRRERFLITVLVLEQMSALNGIPRFLRTKLIGAGEPAFCGVEVAQHARGTSAQREKIGASSCGRGGISGKRFRKFQTAGP